MFEGHLIYLSPLERKDLSARVKWINDLEIRQTLMFDYPISLAKTEQWFQNSLMDNRKRNFSVFWHETKQIIGMAGLIEIDVKHHRAQFYVTIGEKEFWGRRIADEVISIILHYGFVELNLNKIFLYTISNNDRAKKVYQRNGFVSEGLLRQHHYCVGKFQDLHQYGILRTEWEQVKDKLAIVF